MSQIYMNEKQIKIVLDALNVFKYRGMCVDYKEVDKLMTKLNSKLDEPLKFQA
jgi:hypothetical protein